MSNAIVNPEVNLYQGIRDILLAARTQVRQTVNTAMVQAYWQIGRLIVEDEQGGERPRNMASACFPNWQSASRWSSARDFPPRAFGIIASSTLSFRFSLQRGEN